MLALMVAIVMGVSGSGKTTIGVLLARDLGWRFIDADDYHSPENIQRMAAGGPLSDADRQPWLHRLRDVIAGCLARKEDLVLACSALKESYRRTLAVDPEAVRLVYLKGDSGLIRQRLRHRSGHFVRENLLASQFAALEEPRDAVTVNVADRLEILVPRIREGLGLGGRSDDADDADAADAAGDVTAAP